MLTMKIKFDAYQQILQQQQPLTPETGGILGGDGTTIFTFEPDKGLPCGKMCSYAPDVQHLNRVIREWECSGTEFMGIYHTHFHNVCTLSQGDKKYIESILLNKFSFNVYYCLHIDNSPYSGYNLNEKQMEPESRNVRAKYIQQCMN